MDPKNSVGEDLFRRLEELLDARDERIEQEERDREKKSGEGNLVVR